MARVSIDGDALRVDVEGLDRVWSLKSQLMVPLKHVRGATADPGIAAEPKGWRLPGTHLPGVIVAGTFYRDGERIFWDVHDGSHAVVIELKDENYARLVVEVQNPPATVDLVENALASLAPGS